MMNPKIGGYNILLVTDPTRSQIQAAAEWLAAHPAPNLDLGMRLHGVLQNPKNPQESGTLVAIALHTPKPFLSALPKTDEYASSTIRGVVVANPGNSNVSLASCDSPLELLRYRVTAAALFALIQPRGCPRRIATSSPDSAWLRPLLLHSYHLEREHYPLVMTCTQVMGEGEGRWALPEDKPALEAYAAAYRAERGSGSLTQDWDDLIQRQQVAVLTHQGTIVAVVKRGATLHHGIVVGTFTFPEFRQQGFARRLLTFFTQELLKEHPAVKLWVDEDNLGAIALYRSVGFQQTGSCYTGHFTDHDKSAFLH